MRVFNLALAASAAVASPAVGVGHYNMPTSLPQCMGMGFGPGYHAPLLLGPKWKAGVAAQPVRRLPAPLPPPACGGFDAPSVWGEAPPPSGGPWHAPPLNGVQQQATIGETLLFRAAEAAKAVAPATRGTGFVGGAEVIPAPSPGER